MPFSNPGNVPSRGLQNHSEGASTLASLQDQVDGDSLQGPITTISGIAAAPDALNPHIAGNYMIISTAVDPITLGLPFLGGPATFGSGVVGGDDGLCINIWSDTAFAHTVTLPSAKFARGTAALATVATFTAQRGAGMTLRAWNGTWQVIGSSGVALA